MPFDFDFAGNAAHQRGQEQTAQNFGPRERGPAASFSGGGGGYNAGPQTPQGSFWDPGGLASKSGMRGWVKSPDAQLAEQKQQFDQTRFKTVWDGLNGMMNRFGAGSPYTIGGSAGKGPNINAGPIWGQQQINQQVNASRANTDAAMQNQNRELAGRMGGMGMGGNSPLLAALQNQNQNAARAQNADSERGIRSQMAQANAEQQLKGQTAQSNQFTQLGQLDVERAKPYFNLQNSLISALAGMA